MKGLPNHGKGHGTRRKYKFLFHQIRLCDNLDTTQHLSGQLLSIDLFPMLHACESERPRLELEKKKKKKSQLSCFYESYDLSDGPGFWF